MNPSFRHWLFYGLTSCNCPVTHSRKLTDNVYLESGKEITWTPNQIGQRRRTWSGNEGWVLCYNSSTVAPTTAPTPTEERFSEACCNGGERGWYFGSCGALQTKTDCWGGDMCFASSSDDCCSTNVGAVAGVVIAVLVIIGVSVAACCFCCTSCPGHHYMKKPEDDPVDVCLEDNPSAGVGVSPPNSIQAPVTVPASHSSCSLAFHPLLYFSSEQPSSQC